MSSSRGDSSAATSSAGPPAAATRSGAMNSRHLAQEDGPSGLVREHDVVVALQRHQPRSADVGREVPRVLEVVHLVAAAVQHQGGQVEFGEPAAGVGRLRW